mmetsp:Transcript_9905/g.22898  ORF Transcript_9905/g.22898 Transcript_9905/m.22898 type:complete len:213 (+) Transcript_9905:178-816(+)
MRWGACFSSPTACWSLPARRMRSSRTRLTRWRPSPSRALPTGTCCRPSSGPPARLNARSAYRSLCGMWPGCNALWTWSTITSRRIFARRWLVGRFGGVAPFRSSPSATQRSIAPTRHALCDCFGGVSFLLVNAHPRSVAIADRRNSELGDSNARGAKSPSSPQEKGNAWPESTPVQPPRATHLRFTAHERGWQLAPPALVPRASSEVPAVAA